MATKDRKETQDLSRRDRSASRVGRHDPFEGWAVPFWPFGALGDRWFGRSLPGEPSDLRMWSPQVETLQNGDQYVVRVDLPGLKREDVTVEVGDDQLIIQGERRHEREEDREGYYRSERSYGSFYRAVQLPEGAIADTAAADFRDGVLEVTITAPPREVSRGRRIEIGERRAETLGRSADKVSANKTRE